MTVKQAAHSPVPNGTRTFDARSTYVTGSYPGRTQVLHVRSGMLRRLLVLAGGLYVSGALGFEMISGLVADARGLDTLLYATLTSIEEILELSGLSVFLIVVIGELRLRNPRLTVTAQA